MSLFHLTRATLLGAGLAAAALACEATGAVQGPRLPPGAAAGSDTTGATGGGIAGNGLYLRLNGEGGIRTIVTDFVGRAVKDTRINGFLLNRNVIPQRLIECLVLQLGAATGGPQMYPSAGCRDMKTTHRNLGISMVDFTDTAAHLVAALETYNVAPADRAAILSVLESMVPDIVEDPGNNRTVYQRIGRRPVIEQVVVAFMSDVFNDPRINGFFAGGDAARLQTCLVRMICSIDGPCKYGEEVDGFEAGVSRFAPCKDMVTAHQSIVAPRAITKADFDAVVQNLVGVLDRARVAPADKEAILRALGPTCRQIVPQGAGCN